MITKLGNLTSWKPVNPGDGILLPGKKRRVRIAFNTQAATKVVALQRNEVYVLGVVTGMQEYEFGASGDVEIHLDTDQVALWRTDDGVQTATQPSTDSFTKMMERKERNPELEYMMYMAEQNAKRRSDQMLASAEAMIERRLKNEISAGATRGTPQPEPVAASGSGAPSGAPAGAAAGTSDAGTNGAGGQSPSAGNDAGTVVPKQPEASSAAVAGK